MKVILDYDKDKYLYKNSGDKDYNTISEGSQEYKTKRSIISSGHASGRSSKRSTAHNFAKYLDFATLFWSKKICFK